jgi:TonB-linked outer membrane protein, SusC/RagA family
MKNIRYILFIALALFVVQTVAAQTVLTGTVKDKVTGDPLVGANIFVMNSTNRSLAGTSVDINGEFRLSVPSQKNLTIVFSFIGYKSIREKYIGQKTINILMEEEGLTISGIEITAKKVEKNALGMTPKEQISSSQKLTLGNIETAPVSSLTEALQGAMSNVDVLSGADPGGKSSIRIRGTSSLNASSDPLFVVDGVPLPVDVSSDFSFATANSDDYGELLNISPSDIESIEVLKDAAATAVWGSKGANGVLLIKTKKGAKGKIQFSFNTKYEFRKEGSSLPMLNANQYVSMIQDAIWNTVGDLGEGGAGANKYLALLYDTKEIGFDPSWKYFKEYNQDTNWLKEVSQTGYSVDNNFSMSGGGDKAIYRLSLGYLTEEGTTIGTGFNRISAMFDVNYKFSDKLDISANFNFTQGVKNANYTDNARSQALTKMPNMSPYMIGEDGKRTSDYFTPYSYFQGQYSDVLNPVALVNESVNKNTTTSNRMIFNLHYNFFEGFDYRGIVGFDVRTSKSNAFLPQSVTGVSWVDNNFNYSTTGGNDKLYLTTENRFIYNKSFSDNHKLLLSAIFQTSDQTTSSYSSSTSGNSSSQITDPISGSNIRGGGSGRVINRELGGVLNAHYTLFNKYLFDAGYRMEASSSMASKGRWGGFPTVGVAWQLGDEKFVKDLKQISTAKVRLSWGQSGNTPTGASPYVGTFKPIVPGYGEMVAIQPYKIQLNNLKWETVTQTNLGLDLGFFDNTLNMSVDLYKKLTTDMLQKDVDIPTSTGFSSVAWYNSGKMSNKGWEFRLDYDVLRSKDWGLQLNFNIAQNKNEVLEMPENKTATNYSLKNGAYAYKLVEGDPLGSFYGYKYLGVYQNTQETYARDNNGQLVNDIDGKPVVIRNNDLKVYPGDAKYMDVNGDGVINQYDIVYIGNCNPTVTGGFGFNLRYKSWGLVANFHGRAGQKAINQARINMENMYGKNNQSTAVLKRWRHEGDDTEIPRALYDRGYNYLGSDRFVEDASFLRLKTLTVKYTLPKSLSGKVGVQKAEFYFTGYDLITLTKYTGQDPEISTSRIDNMYEVALDKASTPKPLRFAFGLNLKF